MGSTGSLAELTTLVKDIYEQLQSLSGTLVYIDHAFYPSITVTDEQTSINFSKPVYFIKISASGCDIYANFDREIKPSDRTVIYADSFKIISRKTSTLYLQAPSGLSGTATVEALILS